MLFKLKVSFLHLGVLAFVTIVCFVLLYRDLSKLRQDQQYFQALVERFMTAIKNTPVTSAETNNLPAQTTKPSVNNQPSSRDRDLEQASITSDEYKDLMRHMHDIYAEDESDNENSIYSDSDNESVATEHEETTVEEKAEPYLTDDESESTDQDTEQPSIPGNETTVQTDVAQVVEATIDNTVVPVTEPEIKVIDIVDQKIAKEAVKSVPPKTEDITFKTKSKDFSKLSENELKKKTVLELKQYLKNLKKNVAGTKNELIDRILQK